jgi:hypothetical protein
VLTLLIQEVLLKEIDLVVLVDTLLDVTTQFLDGYRKRWVLLYLLLVLVCVLHFSWVNTARPLCC